MLGPLKVHFVKAEATIVFGFGVTGIPSTLDAWTGKGYSHRFPDKEVIMRISTFVAATVLALVLSGCAGTNFTYDDARKVQIGMTEEQVAQIMGPPYSVASRADGQMWIWSHANGMTGASRVISFRFVDGKVVEVPTIPASFK